ncbi:ferric-chelate reductase [NAD(P)H] [Parelusimicrobium proximum]|uniref:flavin reductase family protein n=1 Tax=Parelusimicrobium proximum TaxID=3228953 RepID=UPI003D168781
MINDADLRFISYGLYIITSHDGGGHFDGMIANSLFQVTADPAQLALSINKNSLTGEYIKKSRVFCAMPLTEAATLPFIGPFGFRSGRDINKFEKVKYKTGALGAPVVLENTAAAYEVKVSQELDLGTHILFIGRVVSSETINSERECMTYEYYTKVIKGKTPLGATHK